MRQGEDDEVVVVGTKEGPVTDINIVDFLKKKQTSEGLGKARRQKDAIRMVLLQDQLRKHRL